jgi:predicted enzyme related to lactoylglutathione lyase
MEVLGICWAGTRTERHDETAAFFREVLRLPVKHVEPDFTVFGLPDGAALEIFGPSSRFNPHMTHPVVGFLVADLDQAHDELVRAGAEIVLPIQRGPEGAWLHFRAPDGFVYELSEQSNERHP